MSQNRLYLIPGFFGFADLGGISYFHHIRGILNEYLGSRDLDIYTVETFPTASIRTRALQLAKRIYESSEPEDRIHLVGHSTGGLDARLLASKEVSLDEDFDHEAAADRIASIVTVSTPHYGTPVASFFDSLLGQKILYLWSLVFIYVLRFGELPLTVLFKLAGLLTHLDDIFGLDHTILDQFYDELLSQFDQSHRVKIQTYLNHILTDQSALGQITPGSIDLFNASVHNRSDVEYGSVITRAKPPDLETIRQIGFHPYELASHSIYRFVYRITARARQFKNLPRNSKVKLDSAYPGELKNEHSDGIVPTKSQHWGRLIHAARADHLDVCGHFKGHAHRPPHIDWLTTGSGFGRGSFEALWADVADFVEPQF